MQSSRFLCRSLLPFLVFLLLRIPFVVPLHDKRISLCALPSHFISMSRWSRFEIHSPLLCFCVFPFPFCFGCVIALSCRFFLPIPFFVPLHGKCISLCALLPRFISMSRWSRFEIPFPLFCFRALPFLFFSEISAKGKIAFTPSPAAAACAPAAGLRGEGDERRQVYAARSAIFCTALSTAC